MRKVLLASVMALGIGLFATGCENGSEPPGGDTKAPTDQERQSSEDAHDNRLEEGPDAAPPASTGQPAKTTEQLDEEAAHIKERGVK